jgi:hypothetical protein
MTPAADPTADLRRSFYLILGTVAVAICVAEIVGAENVYEPSRYRPPTPTSFGADRDPAAIPERVWPAVRPEPTPMFSSNDKSRWATVRAIVETGSYVIARRENFRDATGPFRDSGLIVNRDGRLDSLDVVMNPDTGEFYSSKPPLFPTVLAGGYWVLYNWCGLSLDRDRWPVVIILLLAVNVAPFAAYLALLARLAEGWGATDFGRVFGFTAGCVGTYLTTFSATLNNHTPAACCVLFALYPLVRRRPAGAAEGRGELFLAGLFAGLAVTIELPAAAFAAGLLVPLLVARPRQTLASFVPGLLLPLAAFFAANYAALGRLRPAYSEFGGPWYEYGGSHWLRLREPVRPRGIDFNAEPPGVYLLHLLVGHHGWFSLTPAWVVGLIGLAGQWRRVGPAVASVFRRVPGPVWTPPLVAALTAAVTAVLVGFFLTRTASYNYGGNTSGLRWLFWLTPLWLLAATHGADRLAGSRAGRWFAAGCLGVSVLSVFYPAANPWRPPWLQQLFDILGWVRY